MGKLYTKDTTSDQSLKKYSRRESLFYLILWVVLFMMPLLSIYIHTGNRTDDSAFPWHELLMVWKEYAIFLVAFLIHNYLLAPLLIYRQRRTLYLSWMAVLLTLFVTVQCIDGPNFKDRKHPRPGTEQRDGFNTPPPFADDFNGEGVPPEFFDGDMPPMMADEMPPMKPEDKPEFDRFKKGPGPHGHHGPGVIGEHDIVATIIFILMIGMNLGVKLYFRQQRDQERMKQLEHENLEKQLEYLKYQINPHFLMNTLNNIHALVDIEPEQAKETIVELSKIMRFVLYEGSKQKVPLRQELTFLENYIDLMKMRVAEQVSITVNMPDIIPDREIPPLLLITFVENAFKHGVSYQQKSFIDIDINAADDKLLFVCKNSKIPQTEDHHGGVGLSNAKRRLDLLYSNSYTLDIDDTSDTYTVNLSIPL